MKPSTEPPDAIDVVLRLLDEGYEHRSWHGTNLRGSIRGLTPAAASWRPNPRRPDIWELVIHCAYWKYTVTRRLRGGKRGSFPLKGSNWFTRPVPGAAPATQWKSDLALLAEMHRELRDAVAELAPRDLRRPLAGGRTTVGWLVRGTGAHDLYHAGQIQLLKRLRLDAASSGP